MKAEQKLLLVITKVSNLYVVQTSNAPNNKDQMPPTTRSHTYHPINIASCKMLVHTLKYHALAVSNPTGPKLLSSAECNEDKK